MKMQKAMLQSVPSSHPPILAEGLRPETRHRTACRAAADSLVPSAPLPNSRCPMSGLVQGMQQQQQLQRDELYEELSYTPTPGPAALSLESVTDVSLILRKGIHEAMLSFSNKYGPVCRHATLVASSVHLMRVLQLPWLLSSL